MLVGEVVPKSCPHRVSQSSPGCSLSMEGLVYLGIAPRSRSVCGFFSAISAALHPMFRAASASTRSCRRHVHVRACVHLLIASLCRLVATYLEDGKPVLARTDGVAVTR